MADAAPRRSTAIAAAALVLIAVAGCGRVYLPRLTLVATSSLQARRDGASVASRWTVGAILGWRARGDRDDPDDLDDPIAETGGPRNAMHGTRCPFESLCRWELAARNEALLTADTLLPEAEAEP